VSDPEEPEERSGAGGGCVLAMCAAGAGAAVYAVSRDVFVIVIWVVSWALIWWVARAPNPAPPPVPEVVPVEEPQVSIVKDPDHPNRWIVNPRKTGTS